MPRDVRFWRNAAIIGICHVAVLFGLIRWSAEKKKVVAPDVVWMEGGALTASAVVPPPTAEPEPEPEPIATPPPEEAIIIPPVEEPPPVTPVASEIELATPTPTPQTTPSPTPRPAARPSPTPKPTARPKATATPKRKPTPTPKPSPKQTMLAKASPAPKPKPTPPAAEAPTPAAEPQQLPNEPPLASSPARTSASGTSNSATGRGRGTANPSQLASYRKRLHDRFYSGWVQPTTTLPAGSKMSALVQVRIEQDGRVSGFNIVRPSGNVVVDDSVAAVAGRVTRVDPLPASLGNGPYEVKINFELNPEQ